MNGKCDQSLVSLILRGSFVIYTLLFFLTIGMDGIQPEIQTKQQNVPKK